MKRLWLILMTFAAVLQGFPQEIPNSGFENWTLTDFFEEPASYSTSNSLSFMFGDTANVIKSSDSQSGSFAARLETLALGSDTIPGLMMIGRLVGETIAGGVPFNDRPDSLTGYVKYDMAGSDELYILCLFTRGGLPIGTVEGSFTGTQSNYTRISIPVEWFVPFLNPDTLKVIMANTSDVEAGTAGSVAWFDNFQFAGTTLPFPNGGFEDWAMISSEEPDGWTTLNYLTNTSGPPYATRTNESYSGSWAIRISNTPSFVGETIGYLTNGNFIGFDWAGGMPVDQNPQKISGYYKYDPVGNDSAQAGIFSSVFDPTGDSSVVLDYQLVQLPAASDYTYFEVMLDYNGALIADTLNISFSAGLFGTVMNPGSVLLLDELAVDYYPLTTGPEHPAMQTMSVFPVPSSGNVRISTGAPFAGGQAWIFDSRGRTVLRLPLETDGQGGADVTTGHLPDGLYLVRFSTSEGQSFTGRMILQR
jgi:hypothetical protein